MILKKVLNPKTKSYILLRNINKDYDFITINDAHVCTPVVCLSI